MAAGTDFLHSLHHRFSGKAPAQGRIHLPCNLCNVKHIVVLDCHVKQKSAFSVEIMAQRLIALYENPHCLAVGICNVSRPRIQMPVICDDRFHLARHLQSKLDLPINSRFTIQIMPLEYCKQNRGQMPELCCLALQQGKQTRAPPILRYSEIVKLRFCPCNLSRGT